MEHKYGIKLKDLQNLQKRRKRFSEWARFCACTVFAAFVATMICFGIAMMSSPATHLSGVNVPASFHLVGTAPANTATHQSDGQNASPDGPRNVGDAFSSMTSAFSTIMPFLGMIMLILGLGICVMTNSMGRLIIVVPMALAAIFMPRILTSTFDQTQTQPSLTWQQRVNQSNLDNDPRGWYILAQSKVVAAQKKDAKAALDPERIKALGASKYASKMDPSVLYVLEKSALGHPVSTAAATYLTKAKERVKRWNGRAFGVLFDFVMLGLLTLLLVELERRIRHRLQRVITAMRNSARRSQQAEMRENFDPQATRLQRQA